MLSGLRHRLSAYSRQFWILFVGQLVSSIGMSLVWPFMTIYVREKMDVTLTVVGLVLAANSMAGLLSQLVGGPVVDRFGRKIAMTVSLGARAVLMLGLGLADSLFSFSVLILLSGFFGALFNPALNSMVADIVESERRTEAYALMRMVANLGIAIGPAIGGFIATRSYLISFLAAGAASAIYFFITLLFVKETRPEVPAEDRESAQQASGYGPVLRDFPFLLFCVTYAIMGIAYAQMMTIFPVYIKDQYLVPESQFGLIMATNAAMVVLFQYPVTRGLRRLALGPTLTLGALFVSLGLGFVAFSTTFSMFLFSMVIVTIGELIFAPSSVALVAELAPETMRGRYMGIFGMSFGLTFGVAPAIGGLINDHIGPVFVWRIMAIVALLSAVAFLTVGGRAARESARTKPISGSSMAVPMANPPSSSSEKSFSRRKSSLK
ncbi:MAG: MFS transporter [Anaerolineae bacterium]|nr:MFS transporter [Anaerolineae bacterium]